MDLVILDCEAVSALLSTTSNKHTKVVAHFDATTSKRRKRRAERRFVVPTTVRVEARWDRSVPQSAFANQLNVDDDHLDAQRANKASAIAADCNVTPADAHIGALVAGCPDEVNVAVLTSDEGDIEKVSDGQARVIHI